MNTLKEDLSTDLNQIDRFWIRQPITLLLTFSVIMITFLFFPLYIIKNILLSFVDLYTFLEYIYFDFFIKNWGGQKINKS